MGCFKSKTKEPPKLYKNDFEPELSHVPRPSEVKDNEEGKNSKKKGKFTKYRFDAAVSEKYEIKATIGRGTYARVVRVEHKETKQPYAIKVIDVRGSKDVFESDIGILRRLKHPNIVQHYEVFQCPGKLYVVMELATGGELFERIVSKGYFTERDATRVMYMVLDGVQYLHSQGITHRDLKPENLLYYHPGNDSKIMITDFGFAKSLQNRDDPTMETTCGSPQYFAPEMLAEIPYTNAVDLWAVGVITYILLSGNMPFADENQARLYRQIRKAKYSYKGEPWEDVSDTAKDFIDRLLVVNPEKRLTAEAALKHHWIASNAALSSQKNLHGSFTENWRKHSASRNGSARSNRSQRSSKSSKSRKSSRSHKGTIGVPVQEGLVPATKHEVQAKTGQLPGKGPVTRHTNVKLNKQLLEECKVNTGDSESKLAISGADLMAHSNQIATKSNATLLSIQEIPQAEEIGSCPMNEFPMLTDLERKKETPTGSGTSTDEQGAKSDGMEPASLRTMRDNFLSSAKFGNAEGVQFSIGPRLDSHKVAHYRGSTMEGHSTSPRSRVHPTSTPLPRTNKFFCSEVAPEHLT